MSGGHPIENLFKWLRTFSVASSVKSIDDVADGIILAKVLHAIAPNYFTTEWLQRLNTDADINWRLKVNNLKKILDLVLEYLSEVIEERGVLLPQPNITAIVEEQDLEATFCLLQLILWCAVNGERKQTYIEAILCMEHSVQQALMEAIQQLMSSISKSVESTDIQEGTTNVKLLLMEKHALQEQYNKSNREILLLKEERSALHSDNDRLAQQLVALRQQLSNCSCSSASSTTPLGSTSMSDMDTMVVGVPTDAVTFSPTVANVRINGLQNQVSKLREELYRADCDREELRIKLTEATTKNQELKQKCSVLMVKAEEADHLKDELDIAREAASNASRLSTTVEQLRKRADEAIDLRARCVQLEADNEICIQRIRELEQGSRLGDKIRLQAETQRIHAADAQLEATEANRRADLAECEVRRLNEELIYTCREKERVIQELASLRSCCESLQQSCIRSGIQSDHLITHPNLHSQMLTLQEELSRLSTSYGNLNVDNHSIYSAYDFMGCTSAPCPTRSANVSDLYKEQEPNTTSYTTKLEQTEAKLTEMEQKYRAYLWKARDVIQLLERQQRMHADVCPQFAQSLSNSDIERGEICRLRELLTEKEGIIEKLETYHDQMRRHRDTEERLFITAWYNIVLRSAQNRVEQRWKKNNQNLNNIVSSTADVGDCSPNALRSDVNNVSLLTRQREIHLNPPRGLTSVVMAASK